MSNLNPKLFSAGGGQGQDVERVAIRDGYGKGLLQAGKENENIVALSADLTESTKTNLFAEAFPKRFFEMGVAEANMAAVASGMAAMGAVPFMASYAMFSPGKNWEQIRTTICYNNVNVKIVGAHAGISVGPDGGTHQAIEDIAITRVLPRITVLVPCDAIEAEKATLAAAKMNGPVYIRLAREKTPIVTTKEAPFSIGKAEVIYKNNAEGDKKIGIVACGSLVYSALLAAKELEKDGFSVGVLNLSTIKPLDGYTLSNFAKEYRGLVTVEEHQIAGGMGSAVVEFFASTLLVPIEFIGVKDKFGQSGKPEELLRHYKMDIPSIKEAAQRLVKRIYR